MSTGDTPKTPKLCTECAASKACIQRPYRGARLCRTCFAAALEREVHEQIVREGMFRAGERVAVGVSGGKDSAVLAHLLRVLNERHGYGLELVLLAVDEGIHGYRDDSLEAVRRHQQSQQLPLRIVSFEEMYNGWTMDRVVGQIGRRNNCTFCGVFRRQALERGAIDASADKIATGHNADDLAETVLLNLVRGDAKRLLRCTDAVAREPDEGAAADGRWIPRVKPLKCLYEKEIVTYAYLQRIDYFATECTYAPYSYRGAAREFIKQVETLRPRAIRDMADAAEQLQDTQRRHPSPVTGGSRVHRCARCGYLCSQPYCKACVLLEHLNEGTGSLATRRAGTRLGRE
ncbi:hypothetical protein CDCA_CDCA09G2820 [Cyanidium caldarium]|uniref:Cytoplasmic tRNA 2-thiolation protein 1 n=1 Tax=Cyanidium caldarium TaxID=2771 RepID=A0AAV9IWU0_CYACA|nr:hypothetical protein CDCA_CDCA09G2820 [Cyanidium caldarium]